MWYAGKRLVIAFSLLDEQWGQREEVINSFTTLLDQRPDILETIKGFTFIPIDIRWIEGGTPGVMLEGDKTTITARNRAELIGSLQEVLGAFSPV